MHETPPSVSIMPIFPPSLCHLDKQRRVIVGILTNGEEANGMMIHILSSASIPSTLLGDSCWALESSYFYVSVASLVGGQSSNLQGTSDYCTKDPGKIFPWYLATCSFFDELKVSTNLALETSPFHVVLRVRGASSSRITILSRRKSEAAQLPREPLFLC